MEGEFKVRAVDFEEKSLAEIETELVKQHEEEVASKEQAVEEQKEEATPVVSEEPKNIELDDDTVLSHIRSKYNKNVNSFDELFQERTVQEQLDDDVAAFQKYKKDTGRGLEDFLKLNRDLDSIDENRLLADYYRDNGDDDEDIEYRMSDFSYDEDLDDDSEIKRKKLAKKQELKKAKKYFNDLKEQYKVPLESRGNTVPEEDLEDFNAYKANKSVESAQLEEHSKRQNYFLEKTNELLSDKFEGFGFSMDDNTKIVYKPAEGRELRDRQSNLNNFIGKFLDDNGYLKDAELFHKAIAMAVDPDKTARFFYEKGKADAVTEFEKESKNINMTRNSPTITPQSGIQVKAVEEGYSGKVKFRKL